MAMESAAASGSRTASLWRNRDLGLLIAGQGVSTAGSQISQLAFPLLILALTHSPVKAGIAGALRAIPYVLLSLPAGALVDRWNRKRLMILCDTGRALALGSIPLAYALNHLTLAQVYLVTFTAGTLFVFFNLAETAALTRVVDHEHLPEATSRNETMLNASYTVGQTLGGVLFNVGRVFPFLFDALSYIFSVVSLRFIRTRFQEERSVAPTRLMDDIGEGVRWLWRHRLMRFLAFLTSSGMLIEQGYVLVVIVLAERMRASPTTVGLIFGFAGLSGVVASLLAAPAQRRLGFRRITILVHWIWAGSVALFVFAPNPLALALVTALAFGVTPFYGVAQFSYRLSVIPDALQGRVNSVYRLALYSAPVIGQPLAGVLLQGVGATATVWIFAAMGAVIALAATINPHLRHAG